MSALFVKFLSQQAQEFYHAAACFQAQGSSRQAASSGAEN
jgi:hypothetical protein